MNSSARAAISVAPLVSVADTRSTPDSIPAGIGAFRSRTAAGLILRRRLALDGLEVALDLLLLAHRDLLAVQGRLGGPGTVRHDLVVGRPVARGVRRAHIAPGELLAVRIEGALH